MANVKISDLTAASGVADANEFEINEAGSSKKVTGSQISSYVRGDIVTADISDVTITAAELETLDGVTSSVQIQLNGKAPTSHSHTISDVTDLQTELDGKVDQTSTTGSAELPAGTTGERDGTPSAGYLRFNTSDGAFEGYDGSEWGALGGDSPVKAWVNFDGTGTVSIRESFNVSSITDNGTGDYTVNFATAMPDTNYAYSTNAFVGDGGTTTPVVLSLLDISGAKQSGSIRFRAKSGGGTRFDYNDYSVTIFR